MRKLEISSNPADSSNVEYDGDCSIYDAAMIIMKIIMMMIIMILKIMPMLTMMYKFSEYLRFCLNFID